MVYGFTDCGRCGARVNDDKDERCHNCGAEVDQPRPEARRGPARPGTLVSRLPEHVHQRGLREDVPAP